MDRNDSSTHLPDARMQRLFAAADDSNAGAWFLEVKSGSRQGERIALPHKGQVSLGRAKDSTIVFDRSKDIVVSKHHAVLTIDGSEATLQALNTTNGTYVDGRRIQGAQALGEGCVIDLGSPDVRLVLTRIFPQGT